MKYDIVIAGVGGQGGLSSAVVITEAASTEGLEVRQSEVHGMSQRGGELVSHLRISDKAIAGPLVPEGSADLILAFEPLEALRYLPWLSAQRGTVVSAMTPIKNIESYPDEEALYAALDALPHASLVDSQAIARRIGSIRSANMVLLGAASSLLPLDCVSVEAAIARVFDRKGQSVIELNIRAFRLGREVAA